MGKMMAIAVLLACGCADRATADSTTKLPSPTAPFCVYDTEAPTATVGGVSYDHRAPGVDCVPPEGGEVYSLGFAADGWWLQFDAPRAELAIGEAQPFVYGRSSMLAVHGVASCAEWSGSFTVMSDLPDWSIFVDATCTDGADLRVVGQWSAR